jgi:TusA-related sulfurtransferase
MLEVARFAMDISPDSNRSALLKTNDQASTPDRTLDITGELCPMTFVRTRLALDRMAAGQTLLVLLRGEEPLRNVPRTAMEQGHTVLDQTTGADGVTRLLLQRG